LLSLHNQNPNSNLTVCMCVHVCVCVCREALLKNHKCPDDGAVPFSSFDICVVEWFMKSSNCVLNYDQVKEAVSVCVFWLGADGR
jgi:hypothetical protein